jgi:chromate transporter
LGAVVLAATLLGLNEIVALLGGALAGMVWVRLPALGSHVAALIPLAFVHGVGSRGGALLVHFLQSTSVRLLPLALFFLRIGAVLYGSGYVLVAFLEGELVHRLGWLTQAQLLDAISAGQFTPGPVLSTSAFIGYLLAGVPGAMVSATAIFLPSFLFVLLLNPLIPRLRDSSWSRAFLDAANVSAVALMAAVTFRLGVSIFQSWQAVLLGATATALRLRWRVNPSLLIVASAGGGWLLSLVAP